ncbi:MAG TPA: protein-disulfide reductase DsbD domain-containing protein [Hyphomicrobiaceae bacterium]|nr:protein-disulfide reductase DsbD domain-containing protein [Hyphomicrobiaceae bacterium]
MPRTAAVLAIIALALGSKASAGLESPWVQGYNERVRLSAGDVERGGATSLFAFVEIEMPAGWKTYWRNPGDAGGVPPTFEWSRSENLASARVLYPAPARLTDKSGDTVGYKGGVIFPVEIAAKDAGKPIGLRVALTFGICKDICIPVQAELALDIPPHAAQAPERAALEALERVPRDEARRRPLDPRLTRVLARLEDAKPRLILEASFPAGGEGADIFLEAPDGLYIPLPVRTGDDGGGRLTFEVDLGADVDLAALKAKTLGATLVSDRGQSVASFKID